jgi:transcriptional regulator with XRE-family HTH domain
MKTLGSVLKEYRGNSKKTLREVEELTGISNAYLSQLENNKIKKPSANVLYKLAEIYLIELDSLLSAAGIIQKKKATMESNFAKKFAFYADKLTEKEENEVLEYIKYLHFKKSS